MAVSRTAKFHAAAGKAKAKKSWPPRTEILSAREWRRPKKARPLVEGFLGATGIAWMILDSR